MFNQSTVIFCMAGLIDFVLPREKKFFESLNKQVLLLVSCVEYTSKLPKTFKSNPADCNKILKQIIKHRDQSEIISQ